MARYKDAADVNALACNISDTKPARIPPVLMNAQGIIIQVHTYMI